MNIVPSNPFPNTGTPHKNIRIDPIGYDEDIEDIKLTVESTGENSLLYSMFMGIWSGKTTFEIFRRSISWRLGDILSVH